MNDHEIAALAKAIAREIVREIQSLGTAAANGAAPLSVVPDVAGGVYHVGPLTVDLTSHEATLRGKRLTLKPREFALLAVLARHPDQVFTRERLLSLAWPSHRGESIDNERTVDVHIHRVRDRLGTDATIVRTVNGVGYKAVTDET